MDVEAAGASSLAAARVPACVPSVVPSVAPSILPSILGTATAVPSHAATQAQLRDVVRTWFAAGSRRLRLAMAAFDQSEIEMRYATLPLAELGQARSLGEASHHYRQQAIALATEVAGQALRAAELAPSTIDLVISVSCTGIMIPSVDAHLVKTLGLRPDVRRLPLTELGCAGGAAALARAREFLTAHPHGHVLVVAVELPSLSLQPQDATDDNLVSSAIFGDGAAAVVLGARQGSRLVILEALSHLFPDSVDLLGFELRDDGFHSILQKEVADVLRAGVPSLVHALTARRDLRREDLSFFVLHTGGKKILRSLEQELGLSREDTQHSWEILRRYGNQSSASVLFVLHEWLTTENRTAGRYGLMAAFGPGLSAELLLLEER